MVHTPNAWMTLPRRPNSLRSTLPPTSTAILGIVAALERADEALRAYVGAVEG